MSKKSPKKSKAKVKSSRGKSWDRMLNVKVTAKEYAAMNARARKFAGANLSQWVRFACIQLKPAPSDMARV